MLTTDMTLHLKITKSVNWPYYTAHTIPDIAQELYLTFLPENTTETPAN